MISSYVGENKEFERQYLAGELELEFTPQGTLAEKLRAGGAGIPAFFTRPASARIVAEGKETREFDGQTYVMERVAGARRRRWSRRWKADKSGNLRVPPHRAQLQPGRGDGRQDHASSRSSRSSRSARSIPTHVHLPGIYVHRIVLNAHPEKRIEKRTRARG